MKIRLLTGGTLLLCAALLHAQSEPKTGTDEAGIEAARQGRVALDPNAKSSPAQTLQQAIAFERYKDMAAERQAQKDAAASNGENQAKRTVTAARHK